MKKSVIFKILLSIISVLFSLNLVRLVAKLNVLPTNYFIILISGLVIINVINILFLIMKKKLFNIIGFLISILIVCGCVIGSIYCDDTIEFFDKSFNNANYEVSKYDMVVLSDNAYNDINDVKDLKMGYLSSDDNYIEVLDKIRSSINVSIIEFTDIYELYDALIGKKVSSIVIDDAFLDVLRDDHKDLNNIVKVIYSFDIEKKLDKEEVNENLRPVNIYVSGSDARSETIYNKSRSDVNMIISINPNTHKILITSIPRDYYVDVYGKTGLKDKLTHSGIYGMDVTRKTAEQLFDIKIDYTIKVGFSSVVKLVDLVGGIDIYSDITFNSYHKKGWVVKQGMNHMNGEEALAYSRERYAYAGGDRHRILNQQQVLEAVATKMANDKSILKNYQNTLDSLSNMYITDIPSKLVSELVKNQLDTMTKWDFERISVDGSNASLPTYTAPNSKRYVMIPYEKDIEMARNKINNVINN